MILALLLPACGPQVQSFFSDVDDLDATVAGELSLVSETVDAAIYSFSSLDENPKVLDALLDLATRERRIRFATDEQQASTAYSRDSLDELAGRATIEIRTCRGRDASDPYSAMHHKFAVLDGQTVLTGSYNWTANATVDNFENLVVIHDEAVASSYTEAFERLWSTCTPYPNALP